MNTQNDPLWNNGQTPTSNSGEQKQTPEDEAKKQNDKSARTKRKH